ncbi:MAG: flagellar biosynthetic protein FliQ [Alphaproteobacteria bacterium]|nr:flagellar biosynthetic protein FliQ [Alphaproteobacteria bacterium]
MEPILKRTLIVGLAVALVQSLTSIQEMTLTFVPKIVAIFASLILFLPFMIASMTGLMERIAERIATLP